MATPRYKNIDDARKHFAGVVLNGHEVVDVVGSYRNKVGKTDWVLLAKCKYCGGLFEKKRPTLGGYALVSCGCQSTKPGSTFRVYPKDDPKKKEPPKPKEPKVVKASTAKMFSVESVNRLTRERIEAVWQALDKDELCQAWHAFEFFYAWAVRNGYRRNARLVRKDETLPYHPYNCTWAE